MTDCRLYIIWCEETYYYKIGIASDPYKRIKSLQSACPHKLMLRVFFRFPDKASALKAERMVHKSLKEFNIRLEWFEIPRPVKLFSDEISKLLGLQPTYC